MKLWPTKSSQALLDEVSDLERRLKAAHHRINQLVLEKFELETALEKARLKQSPLAAAAPALNDDATQAVEPGQAAAA